MANPAPGKSCGSCTQCCKIPAVHELQKPGGIYCSHCAIGSGCKIYPDRPTSCRTFMCGWLLHPHMGPELKPDKCHVVMLEQTESRLVVADCDPDRPDAWRAPNFINFLRLVARRLGSDWRVLAAVGERTWLITEHGIMSEAGEVTPFAGRIAALGR